MKIDQTSLDQLKTTLRSLPRARWSQIAAQIQYFGDEVHFWIMLWNLDGLATAYHMFSDVIADSLHRFADTEFHCAFYIRDGDSEVLCAYIIDEELRTGRLDFELGEQVGTLRNPFDARFWSNNA